MSAGRVVHVLGASVLAIAGAAAGVARAHGIDLHGTYRRIGPRTAAEPAPRFGPRHRILYVNRWGGTYSPANEEDSASNRSTIANDVSRIPAFSQGDAAWAEVIACVREIYGPYAIEVVDVEPPRGTTYVESVVGGVWSDLKGNQPSGGVSPFRCEVIERGINFTFSDDFGNDYRELCEVIAQESGHTFGMEHEMACNDPMTYLPRCGLRTFQDADVPCGEFEDRPCSCGSNSQNSRKHLLGTLGPSDDVPPQITLTSPRDGETVAPGFMIMAEASDDVRVDRVEVVVDGEQVGADERVPYQTPAPPDLHAGQHTIEVVAVDGDENRLGASVTVNVPAACHADGDCGDGKVCDVDLCLGAVGAGCEDHSECASTNCFFDTHLMKGYCTVTCDSDSVCPSGFACLEPEFGDRRCMPQALPAGCGCAAGGRTASGALLLLVFLAAGGALIRRGRRSR